MKAAGTQELKYKNYHHLHKLPFPLYVYFHEEHYRKQISIDTQ